MMEDNAWGGLGTCSICSWFVGLTTAPPPARAEVCCLFAGWGPGLHICAGREKGRAVGREVGRRVRDHQALTMGLTEGQDVVNPVLVYGVRLQCYSLLCAAF